jgi:2-iminoacetate synthase
MILSTRETPAMRDELINLGISQISAGSKTSPGGYLEDKTGEQFILSDERPLDTVVDSLIKHNLIPSFCAACYRKERTGEKFMSLARPGAIKDMCDVNALTTLKEYLLDFSSAGTKKDGEALIKKAGAMLAPQSKKILSKLFEKVDNGVRDQYV